MECMNQMVEIKDNRDGIEKFMDKTVKERLIAIIN